MFGHLEGSPFKAEQKLKRKIRSVDAQFGLKQALSDT